MRRGAAIWIALSLGLALAACGSAREHSVRHDGAPGPDDDAGTDAAPDAPADAAGDRIEPDGAADRGPDRAPDGMTPPRDGPPPDKPPGCPTACCADSDCAGNFACVMGACSPTQCRAGFKRCAAACVDANACCPAPENCFNGADDDCDGNPDCADPDCTATAQCVPDAMGTDFRLGVQLGAATTVCPTSFNKGRTIIRKDPRSASASCEGCSCGGPSIDCQVDSICGFVVDGECLRNGPQCTYVTITPPTPDGCYGTSEPVVYNGFQVSRDIGPLDRKCNIVTGLPKLPPVVWGRETAFCETEQLSRAGCPGGNVCIPKQAATVCAVAAGSRACPSGFRTRENDWFLDADDRRSCDPAQCSCEATGGTCPNTVSFGPDLECGGPFAVEIPINTTKCVNQFYAPGFKLVGTQTPPTCGQNNRVTGNLAGKNQQTVCCL